VFGMGWWEISIVGLVMILVLGPKELPHAMRNIARFMRKARRLASEFQGHMDDLVREADLDDVRKTVTSLKNQDIGGAISHAVDPTGEFTKDIETALSDARNEVSEIKSAAGVSPMSASISPATPQPATPEITSTKTKVEEAGATQASPAKTSTAPVGSA
jgi:sec-independent protein translocase protein TatB